MPYIKKERQDELCSATATIETAGELNFLLTSLVIDYIQRKGLNYQHINDVKGALQGCLAEFDRRVTNPYEDLKIQENGDVYPSQISFKGKY